MARTSASRSRESIGARDSLPTAPMRPPSRTRGRDADGHGSDANDARREGVVAVVLLAIALFAYFASQPTRSRAAAQPAPLAFFVLISGSYISLGVGSLRERLCVVLGARWRRLIFGPLVLWLACVAYAAVAGLGVLACAWIFGIYLA